MKTLDELVADKILDLVHYVLLKFIKLKKFLRFIHKKRMT